MAVNMVRLIDAIELCAKESTKEYTDFVMENGSIGYTQDCLGVKASVYIDLLEALERLS